MKYRFIILILICGITQAQTQFESDVQLCQQDDADGCHNLAADYIQGEGVTADAQKAVTYFLKACKLGLALDCGIAGDLTEKGIGNIVKDVKKATKYIENACLSGHVQSCKLATNKLLDDNTGIKDNNRVATVTEYGCESGVGYLCALAANSHYYGRSYYNQKDYPVNDSIAAKWAKKGCKLKSDVSCYVAMLIYDDPNSKLHDYLKGFYYADAVCNGGLEQNIEGCHSLGNFYLTAKDYSLAELFYKKGCNRGLVESCHGVGLSLEYQNKITEAELFYSKACDAKIAVGCADLGRLAHEQGNWRLAMTNYDKACNLGIQETCKAQKTITSYLDSVAKYNAKIKLLNEKLASEGVNAGMEFAVMQEGSRNLVSKVLTYAKENHTLSKIDNFYLESIVTWFDSSSSEGQLIHRIRKDRGTNNYARTSGGTNKVGMASARSTSRSIKSYNARPSTYQAPKPIKSSAQISQQTYKTVHAYYCQTGGTKDC